MKIHYFHHRTTALYKTHIGLERRRDPAISVVFHKWQFHQTAGNLLTSDLHMICKMAPEKI